jgi:hypothetical protein
MQKSRLFPGITAACAFSLTRGVVFATLVALSAAFAVRFAAANQRLSTTRYKVELLCGKNLELTAHASAVLAEAARKLLESSEYNSHSPSWRFPTSELQEEYQRAVGSEQHLRVVFNPAEVIASQSGTLRVREIIVRLSLEARDPPFPDHFVDSVFTIDDKAEVVGYALYSGTKMIHLWRAVAQVVGNTHICRIPADLPEIPDADTRSESKDQSPNRESAIP